MKSTITRAFHHVKQALLDTFEGKIYNEIDFVKDVPDDFPPD